MANYDYHQSIPYLSAQLERKLLGEKDDRSRDMINSFPWLTVPEGYQIQIIFPFCGAAARFRIRKMGLDKEISVYLDVKDQLGCYGEPYWEAYPIEGDTFRCDMANVDELMRAIVTEIEKLEPDHA